MTTELAASVMLLNDLHFQGSVRSGYTIDLDTPACDGGGEGMTPMELFRIAEHLRDWADALEHNSL